MSAASIIDGFIGSVLLYAAIGKSVDLQAFRRSLPFAGWVRAAIAPTIIAAEVTIGASLLLGAVVEVARLMGLVLLGSFSLFVMVVWAARLDVSCQCFGGEAERIEFRTVLRDVALTLVAGGAVLLGDPRHDLFLTLVGCGSFGTLLLTSELVRMLFAKVEVRS